MEHNQRYSSVCFSYLLYEKRAREKKACVCVYVEVGGGGVNESWGKKFLWPLKEKHKNNIVESFYKCHKSLATKDFKKLSKSSCKLVFFFAFLSYIISLIWNEGNVIKSLSIINDTACLNSQLHRKGEFTMKRSRGKKL